MTSPESAPERDTNTTGSSGATTTSGSPPPPYDGRDTRRYVIAIAAGLVVALGALTAGLVLVVRGGSSGTSVIVGSGARSAPQQSVSTPSSAPVTPDTPPAVMGDHLAGDPASAFYVRAADQQGDGHSVIVEEATFAQQSGWVVIHSSSGGTPGPIIGVSSLEAPGHHVNVIVNLKAAVPVGSYLFVMLHAEDNGDAVFDYPAADQPAQVDGQIVMAQIYLNVQR